MRLSRRSAPRSTARAASRGEAEAPAPLRRGRAPRAARGRRTPGDVHAGDQRRGWASILAPGGVPRASRRCATSIRAVLRGRSRVPTAATATPLVLAATAPSAARSLPRAAAGHRARRRRLHAADCRDGGSRRPPCGDGVRPAAIASSDGRGPRRDIGGQALRRCADRRRPGDWRTPASSPRAALHDRDAPRYRGPLAGGETPRRVALGAAGRPGRAGRTPGCRLRRSSRCGSRPRSPVSAGGWRTGDRRRALTRRVAGRRRLGRPARLYRPSCRDPRPCTRAAVEVVARGARR